MQRLKGKTGHIFRQLTAALLLLASLIGVGSVSPAFAHGERNQEPFLRLRTAHFYDVKWSTKSVPVNGVVVITGRFRLFKEWPANLPKPDVAFLGNGTPGPVFVRTESYINGVPAIQSAPLELDRDYAFKFVLKARIPGRHHVHPMINAMEAGPLLGPGEWVTITGSSADFKLPVKTIDGRLIPNLETWGLNRVYLWNGLWFAIAIVWLLFWLRRPLLITRYLAVTEGKEDELISNKDRIAGAVLLASTIVIVFVGYVTTDSAFPRTIPLQGGRASVEPLPFTPGAVKVYVTKSTYDVPGRSLKIEMNLTNEGPAPVQLGEFLTSNLRFINAGVPAAVKGLDPEYPRDVVPVNGLKVSDNRPIAPGETRKVAIAATDVAWEKERLTSLLNDPDNLVGGLLFFFDAAGNRSISNVSGPMVPVFTTETTTS